MRYWRGAALAVTAMAAVAGCGQGSDSAAETTVAPTTAAPTTEAPTTTKTPAKASGQVRWDNLNAGQCVTSWPGNGTVTSVEVVDCGAEHGAEIFWSGQISTASSAMRGGQAAADERCKAEFVKYTGTPAEGSPYRIASLSAEPPKAGATPGLPSRSQSLLVCALVLTDGTKVTASAKQ